MWINAIVESVDHSDDENRIASILELLLHSVDNKFYIEGASAKYSEKLKFCMFL